MTHRTPEDAVRSFVDPLQRAITAFVHGKITAPARPNGYGTLALNDNDSVDLLTAPGRPTVSISVAIQYEIAQQGRRYGITTVGWTHGLYIGGHERLRYDFHPMVPPRITWPHVHIEGAREHTPTGRILVEDLSPARS